MLKVTGTIKDLRKRQDLGKVELKLSEANYGYTVEYLYTILSKKAMEKEFDKNVEHNSLKSNLFNILERNDDYVKSSVHAAISVLPDAVIENMIASILKSNDICEKLNKLMNRYGLMVEAISCENIKE